MKIKELVLENKNKKGLEEFTIDKAEEDRQKEKELIIKQALNSVGSHGIIKLSEQEKYLLKEGIESNYYSIQDLKNKLKDYKEQQQRFMIEYAREVMHWCGDEFISRKGKKALEYGLVKGLLNQKEINLHAQIGKSKIEYYREMGKIEIEHIHTFWFGIHLGLLDKSKMDFFIQSQIPNYK